MSNPNDIIPTQLLLTVGARKRIKENALKLGMFHKSGPGAGKLPAMGQWVEMVAGPRVVVMQLDAIKEAEPQGPKGSNLHYYNQVDRTKLQSALGCLAMLCNNSVSYGSVSYSQPFIKEGRDFNTVAYVTVSQNGQMLNTEVCHFGGKVFIEAYKAVCDVSDEISN